MYLTLIETKGLSYIQKKNLFNEGAWNLAKRRRARKERALAKSKVLSDGDWAVGVDDQRFKPFEYAIIRRIKKLVYDSFIHFDKNPVWDRLVYRETQILIFDLLYKEGDVDHWNNEEWRKIFRLYEATDDIDDPRYGITGY